ncbi:hypothetical protein KAR91_23130, partial [Candidatus Pacearchaeota archaeon]|nr:hypothetical protein [Candidatus Pacearchaeota archaeon]
LVGTTTNKTTYKDRILDTANTNPIVLDSRGECVVYFSGTIKFLLKTSADVEVWSMDNLAIDDAITSLLGFGIRPKFAFKDGNEIYVDPGVYEINGKIVYWNSTLTLLLVGGGASDFYYVYLDDSAIGNASKLLTASDFIYATTVPAWSDTKHGWYNGEDKCIFAVLTDGANDILEFFHEGDYVFYADGIVVLAATDYDEATDVDCAGEMPIFATVATIRFVKTTADQNWSWLTNGQTATAGHLVITDTQTGETAEVLTDGAQIFEVKPAASDGSKIGATVEGWHFPIGM